MDAGDTKKSLSRRGLLKLGMAGTAAGLLASGLELAIPTPALAEDVSTPDAALKELMAGNKRYSSNQFTAPQHDLEILRAHTAEKQTPFAAILSCADSRVPAELIFDQTIGHVFVVRVAGNVLTPEVIGSLEYGAVVLGAKVLLVLGHASCGAVKAAIAGKSVPGQISSLFPHLQPAVDEARHDLVAATKANARIQATLLSESSTVISGMVQEQKVKVVAGYYDLESGVVTLL